MIIIQLAGLHLPVSGLIFIKITSLHGFNMHLLREVYHGCEKELSIETYTEFRSITRNYNYVNSIHKAILGLTTLLSKDAEDLYSGEKLPEIRYVIKEHVNNFNKDKTEYNLCDNMNQRLVTDKRMRYTKSCSSDYLCITLCLSDKY